MQEVEIVLELKYILNNTGYNVTQISSPKENVVVADVVRNGLKYHFDWTLDTLGREVIHETYYQILNDKFNTAAGGPSHGEGSNPT